ncbi:MAG: SRPBCC family protein [Bacteroidetes bacterium]|jgi:ligand-binding SRPBCC domain-containing protein|nr:SRPBCC family protein [Bacteroidota bacterium]
MPRIVTSFETKAPIEIVFDLSRSIDFHMHTQKKHHEIAIKGKTSGLSELGDTVTWHARHFGIPQFLTAKITQYDRPYHFRDSMVKGAFKSFDHDHIFKVDGDTIFITDIFDYESPFYWIGNLADSLFLKKYMTNFFERKNQITKEVLESGAWKQFISE